MPVSLVFIVLSIVVFAYLSFRHASLLAFSSSLIVLLLAYSLMSEFNQLLWLSAFVLLALLHAQALRQAIISRPILRLFQKLLPPISNTEQAAIDAGSTWWEQELLSGNPDWQTLHHYPAPRLSAEEQAFFDGPVNEVCAMVSDWQVTHESADLPAEVWDYLKAHKFFALIIKKQYGGLDFSAYAQSLILQRLASCSAVLSTTVGVPNSLGPAELLQHYGNDEQRNYYLPRLACGEEIPCFALTSPEAGSDASSIRDQGIVCVQQWQGKQTLGIRLTWDKRYITLAPVATLLGLAFKLYDPQGLIGDKRELGISLALIPTDLANIEIGLRHFPLNIPFMNGPTRGKNVFIPIDYLIGGRENAGKGWAMLMECLSVGRGITLPSTATGTTKAAALSTGAYARIRRQFKLPIGQMEGIEEPLARLAGSTYLMDAACRLTTVGIDLGEKPTVISAIVKYHLTQLSQQAAIDAMDVVGGKGICLGPKNLLARNYQGSPIAITVEGANILTRNMIIFGQGLLRCHPYLLKEIQIAQGKNAQQIEQFDRVLFRHIGYSLSNLIRSLFFALTNNRWGASPYKDETRRHYQHITRFSSHLALLSDLTLLFVGGNLKRQERLSARLGDMLSQLYLSSSALKRYQDEGRQEHDLPLLQWSVQRALYQCQEACLGLLNNYPKPFIGKLLKGLLFPLGAPIAQPNDGQDHQLAQLLQYPNESRERLGYGRSLGALATQYENCLSDIIAAEAVFGKICRTLGDSRPFIQLDKLAKEALEQRIISPSEAALLIRTEQARIEIIAVDAFHSTQLQKSTSEKQTKNITSAA